MIDNMIESYQERQALTNTGINEGNIATVAEFNPSKGVRLILPTAEQAGSKYYPYNKNCTFAVGDRVHIVRESGTIIVEYPLGGAG